MIIKKIILLSLFICSLTFLNARENQMFYSTIGEDSLDLMIGQMILVGLGDRVEMDKKDPILQEIINNKVGGIILFEKNIQKKKSKDKLIELISKLNQNAKIPLFIAIDEEGGKVHRLKEKYGFVGMPSASALGELDDTDSTYFYNFRLADELNELGINLNFAPAVDLAVNLENEVLVKKNRCFSNQSDIVTKHAIACIKAHRDHKIHTVIKHFPGHGSSNSDSHLGMVNVESTWKFKELYPYHEIIESGYCEAIMTAHIINKNWDTSQLPATLSYPIMTTFLRGYLNFKGVIFSDDMQMKAISKEYGLEKGIELSINAGVDVLLFGNNVVAADKPVTPSDIHSLIKKLYTENRISENRIRESYQRIILMKTAL